MHANAQSMGLRLANLLSVLVVTGATATAFGQQPTPTPTPSAIPTPTAEEGCQYIILNPIDNDSPIVAGQQAPPSVFANCLMDSGEEPPTQVFAASYYFDPPLIETYDRLDANMLLRWDSSTLPSEGTVTDAWLRLNVSELRDDDGFDLFADWYDWGQACDANDYTVNAEPTALSPEGNCATGCVLANVTYGRDNDFHLDDAPAQINPTGTTALRLYVTGISTPTGENGIATNTLDAVESPGARLVILTCGADTPTPTTIPNTPTPTPTVPAGCQLHTFETVAEAQTRTSGTCIPPDVKECLNSITLPSSDPGLLIGSVYIPTLEPYPYGNFAALLSWDTSSLPPSSAIVAAWLKARIIGNWGQEGKNLKGDWYNWGDPTPSPSPALPTCDEGDIDPNAPSDALSISGNCGSDCLLEYLESGFGGPYEASTGKDRDFRLDLDPNDPQIDRTGLTHLRLHVSDAPAVRTDLVMLPVTDSQHLGPKLIVMTCTNPSVCGNAATEPGEDCDGGSSCTTSCRSIPEIPTPTPSPTQTPSVPEGCVDHALPADDAWQIEARAATSPPNTFYSCTAEYQSAPHLMNVGNLYFPEEFRYYNRQVLFAWNTSNFTTPAGHTISRAWLQLATASVYQKENKNIEGDWYDWSQDGCDASDYEPETEASALSIDGVCGQACRLRDIHPPLLLGNTLRPAQRFELDNPDTQIDLEGSTHLRLRVSEHLGDEIRVNYDGLSFASVLDGNPNYRPQLIIRTCPSS